MANALILGADVAVGGYLARLLQARGVAVFAVPGGNGGALAALGIAGDITQVDPTDAPQLAATLADATVFAIANSCDAGLVAETLARAAAAASPPRFSYVVEDAELRRSPALQTQARAVAALREQGRHAGNAVLHAHDSRLGPASSLPARIIAAATRAAADDPAPALELPEGGARDWGWTPEYVDAVQRLAAAPRPLDLAIGSGHPLTTAEIVSHVFAWFKRDPQPYVRVLGALPPSEAPVDTARLQAATGWSATTWGRDLVRALCEGAADRAG